jgi:hypothetical protein
MLVCIIVEQENLWSLAIRRKQLPQETRSIGLTLAIYFVVGRELDVRIGGRGIRLQHSETIRRIEFGECEFVFAGGSGRCLEGHSSAVVPSGEISNEMAISLRVISDEQLPGLTNGNQRTCT